MALDSKKLKGVSRTVFGALSGAMTSAMIHLGDKLGLYRALDGAGPTTAAELAKRTNLSERWVREWLQQQGAAGVLTYGGDGRFELSAEAAAVLADENHPAFGAGFFGSLPSTMAVAERLPEAFRSGIGLSYDTFGPDGAVGIERGFAPWFRTMLVPLALPRIEGLEDRLRAGARVADVGCGSGVAMIEMAKAFPEASFHGYDISAHALERGRKNLAEAGLENVVFHDAHRDALPSEPHYDFITTFDCLHDMTDPAGIIRQIRKALRPDGIWLICDIKAHATYEENLAENPMVALMYGMSVMTCMSSALSEPGGAGLGTLGFHEDLAREMATSAGFTHFETLELGHPMNAFYVARP